MQYFIGFPSFSNEAPFDPSLFVGIRKRLGVEQINEINEKILQLNAVLPGATPKSTPTETKSEDNNQPPQASHDDESVQQSQQSLPVEEDMPMKAR